MESSETDSTALLDASITTKLAAMQDNLNQQIKSLQSEITTLQAEITPHLRKNESIDDFIQRHIQRLHDYNEMKDLGQALLGQMAELHGCTVRSLYPKYQLDVID